MRALISRSTIVSAIIMLTCLVFYSHAIAQSTGILNRNIQIRGSLHGSALAWASDQFSIDVNKQTGEFEAKIMVDDLEQTIVNPDFIHTGENLGKYLTLTAVLPINDVLVNMNSAIERQVEVTANFNGINYQSNFTFTILKIQSGGFSVMANGTLSIRGLEIHNLQELDDDLLIFLSFTGN